AIPELKRVGTELLATGPVLIAFGFAACLCAALVVSFASLWRMNDSNIHRGLSQGGRSLLPAARPLRAGLSSAQLAIVLALLMLAGLAGRSFLAATDSDAGLDPRGVVTLRAMLPRPANHLSAVNALASQLAAVPGVRSVAYAAELPVGAPAFSTATAAHPGPLTPSDPMIACRLVSAGYFETIGASLAAGRSITAEEVEQGRAVVVLNQSAARLLFGNRNPVGQTVSSGFMDRRGVVAGVVHDIRTEGLDRPPVPIVYMGYLPGWGLRFLIRTESSPQAFASMARERVRSWNSGVTLQQFRALRDTLDDTIRSRIVAASLIGGFALLGLLISSVGLYGTLAGHVQQRSREIAVRMALGATAQSVTLEVLREGIRIVCAGAAAGAFAAAALGRLMRNQLYGVTPLDPLSFCLALLVLAAATFAACLLPALRASRIDPARMLNLQ
ncbi:MAG: ABC transporter permease, partial [Bryobacterales bacterium]|nr:ABC transporter permease [Bryobacterales bacterium]